jgi:hypothetical protein
MWVDSHLGIDYEQEFMYFEDVVHEQQGGMQVQGFGSECSPSQLNSSAVCYALIPADVAVSVLCLL